MGYQPKFLYDLTTAESVAVLSNELSVVASNVFATGDSVEFQNCIATFLNGNDYVLDSAASLLFTAPIVHADVSAQVETGTVGRVLLPSYPANSKPFANELDAIRHDSISGDGHRQVIFERIEEFQTLQFDSVPWADLPAWTTFFRSVLQGGSFRYYPDRTSNSYDTYVLDDQNFTPAFAVRGLSKLTMKMRLFV